MERSPNYQVCPLMYQTFIENKWIRRIVFGTCEHTKVLKSILKKKRAKLTWDLCPIWVVNLQFMAESCDGVRAQGGEDSAVTEYLLSSQRVQQIQLVPNVIFYTEELKAQSPCIFVAKGCCRLSLFTSPCWSMNSTSRVFRRTINVSAGDQNRRNHNES